MQEEHPDNLDADSDKQDEQQTRQKEQVQKILANVRQNFGKIYVAPEFTEDDLVPVEMPDLDMSDLPDSDGEEVSEEEDNGEKDGVSVAPADGETEEPEPTANETAKSKSNKSSREVIRELDDKILKYKQFLERAKCKRFSAIRSVSLTFCVVSYVFALKPITSWSLVCIVSLI